jgi:hypothetical protein
LRLLGRYHLENYFLDESVLAAVFLRMEPSGSQLASKVGVRSMLMDIAKQHASYAVALAASSQIRELVGNVDLMPRDCNGKDAGELTDLIAAKSTTEGARVSAVLDKGNIGQIVNDHYALTHQLCQRYGGLETRHTGQSSSQCFRSEGEHTRFTTEDSLPPRGSSERSKSVL